MLTDVFTINILLLQAMEREGWKNIYMLLPAHIYLGPNKMESLLNGCFCRFGSIFIKQHFRRGHHKSEPNAETWLVSKGKEKVYEVRIRLTVGHWPKKHLENSCRLLRSSFAGRRQMRYQTEETSGDELRRETLSWCLVGRWGMTR